MNRSERTYNQLFGLLRETSPAASLTTEEIQSLIEEPSAEPMPAGRFASVSRAGWMTIVTAVVGVSIAGVWLLRSDAPAPPIPSPAPMRQSASASPESGAARGPQQAPDVTTAAGTTTRNDTERGIRSGVRPKAIAAPSSLYVSQRTASTRNPEPSTAHLRQAAGGAEELAPRQHDITTLPMLELSPKELEALGVVIVDGEIHTIGEESYTLANERDRIRFAAMGLDTTKRTGIIRKHIIIDTFGLTTTKHSWSQVDNYTRIAPIIALHSYVANGRSSTSTLLSFDRSPIMDSAKRSIGSMVSTLASVLASDGVERVMHDSGQINTARILVPVHIRLGDEPIDGSMKRRGADIILWYYPTPEFAAALPVRYRISLQKELNAIADVVECNVPPVEACRQMTGEPMLLNYCKRTSGALRGLNVSPNPAAGTVTVNYTLESQRTITATLHGLRGEYVRELLPAKSIGAGAHSLTIPLGDVTSGAYVIVLRSEQGEKVSERLIVQ